MKYRDIEILKLDSVSSTNEYLKELVKSGKCEPIIVIADKQTNGKGTGNRSFISDKGGIYLSILLKPFDASLITPMTAVAVSEAIEQISNINTQIKWVNDVYINSKKVCGILCEAVYDKVIEKPYIIVGIGVNLFMPQNGFNSQIKDIATSIYDYENIEIKQRFIDTLIEKFFDYLDNIDQKNFLEKYKNKNFLIGKRVTVLHNNIKIDGTAISIDDNCHLRVKFDDNTEKLFSSGEVSLKKI